MASTSRMYHAGQVIAAGQPVRLAQGEKLKLLSGDGKTLVKEGEFTGPVEAPGTAAADRSVTRALATLLRQPLQDASTLGATRSAVVPAKPDEAATAESDAVLLDVHRSGSYCVAPGQKILIRRPPAASSDRVMLNDSTSGRTETLVWSRDGRPAEWPASMPVGEGLSVLARLGPLGGPVRLDLKAVQFHSDDPGDRAVQLIRMDCLAQAKPLIEQVQAGGF